jgi:ubiquinone/menaquinone biosynthesis C-methylase UbiE
MRRRSSSTTVGSDDQAKGQHGTCRASEAQRVRDVYRVYDASDRAQHKRDPHRPGVQRMRSERWKVVGDILAARLSESAAIRVLDVGCGEGDDLARIKWLLPRAELFGIDLLAERLAQAQLTVPEACLEVRGGEVLPFPDGSFQVVMLSTVLSSILDSETRRLVTQEAYRVIGEEGLLLVYDIRLPSPWNPNVVPITRRDLRALLPGAQIRAQSITLLPPLARVIGDVWPGLYGPLACLRPLRTHNLSVVTRAGEPAN